LESLRGVAALCVVLFHIFGNRSPEPIVFSQPTFDRIANLILTSLFGGTGAVTLFFVLSGFVLAESLVDEAVTPRVYVAFIVRRFFRLIPVAWASLGLAVLLMIYFHHMAPPWPLLPPALIFNLSAIEPFNGPLWSINVECFASALFPLLLLADRIVGVVGKFAILLFLLWLQRYGGRLLFLEYLFCFQAGIMTRELTGPLLARLSPGWAKIMLWFAVGLIVVPTNLSHLGLIGGIDHVRLESVGAVYVVGYAISDGRAALSHVLERPEARFLGRISYSLYAVHLPIIGSLSFVAWGFIPAENYLPAQLLCAAIIVPTTILVAFLSYKIVEQPLHNIGRACGKRIIGQAPAMPLDAADMLGEQRHADIARSSLPR
jgi:peptidoglycan/LPS O-acetylase OafA/YrhL